LQQVDLRKTNSWRLKLGRLRQRRWWSTISKLGCAFVLCNRLSEVMKKDNTVKKHIINVSAMEGNFIAFFKESTSSTLIWLKLPWIYTYGRRRIGKIRIFMNAVDGG
jgi:hypothetical protein